MIYLTKTDKELTKFCLNHRKIEKLEKGLSSYSNIILDNGKVLSVHETEEEIVRKIKEYESDILAMASILQSKKEEK